MKSRLAYGGLTALIALVLLGALSETLLRVAGFGPWTYTGGSTGPITHKPDALLGWTSVKGSYILPPYSASAKPIQMTFVEDGRRATKRRETTSNGSTGRVGELVVVGGSYTQGWAISDEETYPYKLQERYPLLDVRNYGTGGYGTYQSLLVLERQLPRQRSPRIVLYGFIEHHETRNIAPAEWMKSLSQASASRQNPYIPYATIGSNGVVVRHTGRYIALPLREWLATVSFMEDIYMRLEDGIGGASRWDQARMVTEQLLIEMNRISQAHGAQFAVVFLSSEPKARAHYKAFLQQHDITTIDCSYPLTSDMRVPGEGHPNGLMNSRWAKCVADALDKQLMPRAMSADRIRRDG